MKYINKKYTLKKKYINIVDNNKMNNNFNNDSINNNYKNNKLNGLPNIGNTCYLNSTLQTIKHIPIIMYEIILPKDKNKFLLILRHFYKKLLKEGISHHDMSQFYKILISNNVELDRLGVQGDANEAVQSLISKITDNNTTLDKVLKNKLLSNVKCLNCNHISTTKQPLYIINLKIDNGITKQISLEQLLKNYEDTNELTNDNKYKCEKCNKLSNANKTISIDRSANILIISVSRHIYNNSSQKNTVPISYNKIMNYKDKEYYLIGTIYHLSGGNNAMSGHYVNKSYNYNDNSWYHYSDSSVSQCNMNDIETSSDNYLHVYISKKMDNLVREKINDSLKNM